MTTCDEYGEVPQTSAPVVGKEYESKLVEVAPPDAVHDMEDDDNPGYFRPKADWFEKTLWQLCDDDIKPYALIDGEWCRGLYGRLLNFDPAWAGL